MYSKSAGLILTGVMPLLICFFLLGCSGSGGSSGGNAADSNISDENISNDESPEEGPSGNNISGVASKGVINEGMVKAHAVNEDGTRGEELGSGQTEEDGQYSIDIGDHSGPIIVEVTGGSYRDEATGSLVNNNRLRAVIPSVSGNRKVAVTPLTEMAVQIAGKILTVTKINNANAAVSVLIGGEDITETQPPDINGNLSGATDAEKDYSLILAAISQMVEDGNADDVAAVMSMISNDLEDDGELAGNGSGAGSLLQGALNNFIASDENNSGLTQDDISLDENLDNAILKPFFFSGTDGMNGPELWTSDGTEEGTYMVKDIDSSNFGSYPEGYTVAGNKTFFWAYNDTYGYELWVSDGTEAGTHIVKDLWPGTGSSNPHYMREFKGTLFFKAIDYNASSYALHVTDGTEAGTELFLDNEGNMLRSPTGMVIMGDKLLFVSTISGTDYELYITDGTEAGTHLVKDIYPGATSSRASWFSVVGDKVYFQANDGIHKVELWVTDGTDAGTYMVKDLGPGWSSGPSYITDIGGGKFVFRADTEDTGSIKDEIWVSDGTESGTFMVLDPLVDTLHDPSFGTIGNKVVFSSADETNGVELWITDGTVAGTKILKDIQPGAGSSIPRYFISYYNEKVYFAADDGTHGAELWVTDGTAEGTEMLKDINTGAVSGEIYDSWVYDGMLYFQANDGTNGAELWVTDGTEDGTYMVKDSNPGAGDGYIGVDEDY